MAVLSHERRRAHETLRRRDREMIPRTLLRAMAGLVLLVLAIVTWARLTERPLTAMPDMRAEVLRDRMIVIHGSMSGAARVTDMSGAVLADLGETEGGFVAGMWRVLVRERNKHGVSPGAPVRLMAFDGGRLALADPFTGWRAELTGFGRDNAAVFARLLD